jgi:hypothetical protein
LISVGVCSGGLNETPPIALLPALVADAINLEGMAGGHEMVLAANLLLKFANLRRKEFD